MNVGTRLLVPIFICSSAWARQAAWAQNHAQNRGNGIPGAMKKQCLMKYSDTRLIRIRVGFSSLRTFSRQVCGNGNSELTKARPWYTYPQFLSHKMATGLGSISGWRQQRQGTFMAFTFILPGILNSAASLQN